MPRGPKRYDATISSIEKVTERLCNRAEYEIERYCLSLGIRFDDLAGAYVVAAAQRFGHGVSAGWDGVQDQMPTMRLRAAEAMQQLPEMGASQLALGDGRTRQGKASRARAEVQGDRGQEVKPRKSAWANKSQEELDEIQLRRLRKRKDPVGRKMLAGLLKKRRALKSQSAVKAAVGGMKRKPAPARDNKKEAARKLKQRSRNSQGMKNYWASMTPAQRATESKRRAELRRVHKAAATTTTEAAA